MEFLIPLIPYLAALLGIIIRVAVPYLVKRAQTGMTWDWPSAIPVILGGLTAFAGMAAGGLLDAATWQQALGYGLAAAIGTIGGGEAGHLSVKVKNYQNG